MSEAISALNSFFDTLSSIGSAIASVLGSIGGYFVYLTGLFNSLPWWVSTFVIVALSAAVVRLCFYIWELIKL